jgi:hypothetical protein
LSSHLLADVEDVCDRVVIYYGGKIQAAGTLKDLLAEPDTLRITTPVLPRETLERVLEIIRKDVAAGEVRVDNPTQNLESYFLDVVQRARRRPETSGAQSGARVAPYLRAGAGRPSGGGKNSGGWPAAAGRPTCQAKPTPRRRPRRKWTQKKLEALAKAVEPAAAPAKPAPAGRKAGGFVEGG